MSLPIEEVVDAMRKLEIPSDIIIKVENELEEREKERKEDRQSASGPKSKNQFVIIALDPNNQIKEDMTGLVVQIPENESPTTVLDKIYKAARDFNAGQKRKKRNVEKVAEAAEFVKRKFFKEFNIHVKTKTPVLIVPSDNIIPR